MDAVYKKELRGYFKSPIGYVFISIFALLSGVFFVASNINASSSRYIDTLYLVTFVFALVVPILTMRSFAEEKKSRTDQLLLTSPIKIGDIVLGKFLAALTVVLIALAVTLIFPLILLLFNANIEPYTVLGGYVGNLLVGMSLIAIGMFISTLTENQLTSAVVSLTLFLILLLMEGLRSSIGSGVLYDILGMISLFSRFTPFSGGSLSLSAIVYFLSVTALFLFLSARVIEKRRWD